MAGRLIGSRQPIDHGYDVVIVGAGIYGLALAIHLRRLSPEASVLVLEDGAVAESSITVNTSGIIRHSYADPDVHTVSAYGMPFFKHPSRALGLEGAISTFTPAGWARMLNDHEQPGSLAMARDVVGVAAGLGLPGVELLTADELLERTPPARIANLRRCFSQRDYSHVLWEEDGGWADGSGTLRLFAEAALQLGADIAVHARASGFTRSGEKVTGVRVEGWQGGRRGAENGLAEITVPAGRTVIAAGLWLRHLVRVATGLEMPVYPSFHQIVVAHSSPGFPIDTEEVELDAGRTRRIAALPVVSYWRDCYFRPEGGGVLIGLHQYELQHELYQPTGGGLPDGSRIGLDQGMVDQLVHNLDHVPLLAEGSLRLGNSAQDLSGGFYVMNPEELPLEGEVPGTEGSLLVLGSGCGTGFKLGPGVARLLAQRMLGVPPEERLVASAALSVERSRYFFPAGTTDEELRRLFLPTNAGGRFRHVGASGVSVAGAGPAVR